MTDSSDGLLLRAASPDELTVTELHDLLQLRTDIFVVEQACPYPELDGRDLAAGTRHLWLERQQSGQRPTIVATLRLLDDGDSIRIGRVATRQDDRGHGLAQRLLDHALATSSGPWTLSAQTYLQGWYERSGFTVTGPEFLEDDIPHVPMRRDVTGT